MKNYLKECLALMNIETSEQKLDMLIAYNDILIDWNSRINLTAITEPHEVVTKHFCDSLYGIRFIEENASVADIGTGAGFPGIPIGILRTDTEVFLIDSLAKRVKFLDEVIRELKVNNIKAIHLRAEEGAKGESRDSFDIATARAVAPLNILSEICLPYVKKGGLFLAYKGGEVADELAAARNATDSLCGSMEEIFYYTLPNSDIRHSIIPIRKKDKTPKNYPRMFSKITKSPL